MEQATPPSGRAVEQATATPSQQTGRKRSLNDWLSELQRRAPGSGRISAVGRLDKDTTGLLLLTDDGKLSELVLRPGRLPKVYDATVKLRVPGCPTEVQLQQLRDGVELQDGMAAADSVQIISCSRQPPPAHRMSSGPKNKKKRRRETPGEEAVATPSEAVTPGETAVEQQGAPAEGVPAVDVFVIRLKISIGRNRVVRRLLAAVGLPVFELERVKFGPLALRQVLGLTVPGSVVELSEDHIALLRGESQHDSDESPPDVGSPPEIIFQFDL